MTSALAAVAAIGLAALLVGCSSTRHHALPELNARQGGLTTAFATSPFALQLTARNINTKEEVVFAKGKEVFDATWSADGTGNFVGLGRRYDATSCVSCHALDGRAVGPTANGALPIGIIAKLGSHDPAVNAYYQGQLQRDATRGAPVARVTVRYETVTGHYADGTSYTLRRPTYTVEASTGPPIPASARLSIRAAPPLSGLGLLELVGAGVLRSRADPADANHDGISGRLSIVTDLLGGRKAIGRFGWKAEQPTVEQQVGTALYHDLGLTNRYFPTVVCGDPGAPCDRATTPVTGHPIVFVNNAPVLPAGRGHVGAPYEVTDARLFTLTEYSQTLAVPAIRHVDDAQVRRGRAVFEDLGCQSCHAGPYTTGRGPYLGLSHQLIDPGTDLLLHDMGPGLDDRTVGGAVLPTEWRTAPLWGIGLTKAVTGHTTFLHDGRARNLTEAILWHGGEAARAQRGFLRLSRADRDALIRYLSSR